MGIAASELCRYVIRPTLVYLGRHDQTAESLLLGIAASQSELGSALHDRRGHGLYSISDQRHRALWDTYGAGPRTRQPGTRLGQPARLPWRAPA